MVENEHLANVICLIEIISKKRLFLFLFLYLFCIVIVGVTSGGNDELLFRSFKHNICSFYDHLIINHD